MVHFPCANARCSEVLHADDRYRGLVVKCPRCGQIGLVPMLPSDTAGRGDGGAAIAPPLRWTRPLITCLLAGFVVTVVAAHWVNRTAPASGPSTANGGSSAWRTPATSIVSRLALTAGTAPEAASHPLSALESDLLRIHAQDHGDPDLGAKYAALNRAHFAGALPAVAVAWESRLAEVGPLIAPEIVVKGLTDGHVILVNPVVTIDSDEVDAVLSHEVVHVYLFQQGIRDGAHGPSFQQVLSRLLEEGAFTAIVASPAERSQLRALVDSEPARIETERQRIASVARDLEAERSGLDRDIDAFNAQVSAAKGNQGAWPTPAEGASLRDRQAALKARIEAFNQDVEALNRGIGRYNDAVRRYRQMCLYPDGLDGDAAGALQLTVPPPTFARNLP